MTEPAATVKELLHSPVIEQSRIHLLNGREVKKGRYVLYWMRNSHRATMNPSLNLAVEIANKLEMPVVACCLVDTVSPGLYLRQHVFMLEGLRETAADLEKKGITFILLYPEGLDYLLHLAAAAGAVVTDSGYLKPERDAETEAARVLDCPLMAVESSVIVPLKSLPPKEEYSAATLRPKLKKLLPLFLGHLPDPVPARSSMNMKLAKENVLTGNLPERLPAYLCEVPAVKGSHGGGSAASELLSEFVRNKLTAYNENRSDPDLDGTSRLSPYLHFGQISPVKVALAVMESGDANAEKFIDELVVRRELAFNFVRYNDNYPDIRSIPSWAAETLSAHESDRRDYCYRIDDFEHSRTHDRYWNAAQNQLRSEGIIHNYMRMYWGKKIIEWSVSPDKAYEYMVYLNNKYALDGSDPNSYAGIAWCFGKHDRPWGSRPVFGKVRYMNDRGLERKFSMAVYQEKYAGIPLEF